MRRTWPMTLWLCACPPFADDLDDDPTGAEATVDGDAVPSGWRAPQGPCELDPVAPSRLLLTTTDFATGALTVVDLADGSIEADVAVGSTDALPFAHGGDVIVLHRHRIDRIDVLDPTTWRLRAQHALPSATNSANPHAITFDAQGLAYVTTFAEPSLRVLDLARPAAEAERDRIDLSPFADADGNPDANLAVTCGDLLFVTAERLDSSFEPVATDHLIAIDPAAREALDLEPTTASADALPLLGTWVRQLRRDPADERGRTLLALSTGIERIELATGVRSWAVSPATMAEAGIDGRFQPQAFDVDDTGTLAYVAAYDLDFAQVQLYRVGLDGTAPVIPEPFASGFDSVEHTLELVDERLWYGSTRQDQPGLWRFDVTTSPPRRVAGPLPTGLPPYAMAAIP